MGKSITGHIISHTHWDREWRRPLWESRYQLKGMMEELLEAFRSDPDYKAFLFDGQVIAIEDYLELCPNREPEIRSVIEEGKLHIGPWYNLPDLYPVCGEALVRNLQWGIRKAKALGGCLDIGYTTFGWGQTAQFPQLLAGFGIEFVVAGKNVSKQRAPHSEFIWEAPDGTRLMTTRLGVSKRNNFYFHLLIPLRYDKPYKDPTWGYVPGKHGFTFHPAHPEGCCTEAVMNAEVAYDFRLLEPCLEDLLQTTNDSRVSDHLFLGDGTDFSGITPGLKQVIEQLNQASTEVNFVHSSLPEYVKALQERLKPEELETVKGELRDGPAASVTGNALAVRMNIKTLNRQAQTHLLRYAEPIATLFPGEDPELQQRLLGKAWDYLLKSHSHDAINGVTTDKTADDIVNRLQQVLEISDVVYNASVEKILSNLDLSDEPEDGQFLTLFNPLPYEVQGVVETVLDVPLDWNAKTVSLETLGGTPLASQPLSREEMTVPVNVRGSRALPWRVDRHRLMLSTDTLPALGYKTLRVKKGETFDRSAGFWPADLNYGTQMIGPHRMANDFLEVTINGDGTLDVTCKETGESYSQLNFFEYSGDAGDYWQRVEPQNQMVITTLGRPATIRRIADGPLMTQMEITHSLEVPAGVDRKTGRLKDYSVNVSFRSLVTLKKSSRFLEIETEVDNQASDCRFRVGFPSEINTDFADAEGHFTVDHRPIALTRDSKGCSDAQMTTLPMQHWVDVSDGENGLAVLNRNLQEYEVTNDSSRTLMLTLMRCVPMRMCSEYRAPQTDPAQTGAQMHGKTVFNYAMYPHAGNWKKADIYSAAESFNAPPKLYQHTCPRTGSLPAQDSAFSLGGSGRLSAVTRTEDRKNLLIRIFNPASEDGELHLQFKDNLTGAGTVSLKECGETPCPTAKNEICEMIGAGKIQNYKLYRDGQSCKGGPR